MAYDITAPNTGASLESLDSDSLRKLWRKTVDVHEQEEDFFQEFEGNRSDSLIETVNDTSKGAGQRITFTSMAGFYQEGKHGDEVFDEQSDYEKARINSNSLYVDYLRNGTRWTERMEDHMGLQKELSSKFPEELGKWLGRKKNRAAWMKFLKGGTGRNKAYAGGGTDVDALGGSNVLSWEDIVEVGTMLKNHGAKPAFLGKVNHNPIRRYCLASSTDALRSLKEDDSYLEAQREAGVDGTANVLFTGGYSDVDGHMIREFQPILHDGDGPIGSPITPQLRLASAINSPTSGFTVTGGSNAKTLYTVDFPNHAFKYNASDSESSSSDPFYLLVVNPSNAATDPGKMGFYKCTTNDGKEITVTEALAAAASGIANTTVGDVTWDTGVWSGLHSSEHPAGAIAYLANSKGQPYGYTVFMGACALRRGYGRYRNHRGTDDKEAGFIRETYVVSVFGQAPKINVDGEFPNFMTLTHSVIPPGTPVPTNIT